MPPSVLESLEMTTEQKEQRRILIKKHNIHFDGPASRDKWPSNHEQTFGSIQKLGRTKFTQYHETITIDSEENPWREQTRRRAERIACLARLCREGRKNEAGWRLSLESEILARFTIEVACRKCRARLWRSELEVTSSSLDRFAESLEKRQQKRIPCSCPPRRRREEPHEQGVNLLFDDRAEEDIVHDHPFQSEMPRKEKPDRVYGLRATKRLERLLLWSEDKRASSAGKTIGECIRTSPFRPDGEPIVFPFLTLEAKSEKGRDGFSDVEMQTAFTIRALLKLQEDLHNAAGEESEWESGPLVWSLSNKGEQWRVAAAYIDCEEGAQHYRVVDLWDGRITSDEGALRLLLIVDYIFDWARDIYREAIIGELRTLSASDTPSLAHDSDVFSIVDRVSFWPLDTETSPDTGAHKPENGVPTGVQDVFRVFDSPHGALRDATYIQSRFMALYITEDNLSVLMQSMKTPEKSQEAARAILRCLKDCWRINADALDGIEFMWTGKDRENSNFYSPHKVFFVMVTLTAYLSPSWEQIRELSYLAVSADVIEALLQHANLQSSRHWSFSEFPYVGSDTFVGVFQAFLDITVQENLLATISRACLSTKLFARKAKRNQDPEIIWVSSIEKVENAVKYRFDAAIVPDRHAYAREFVTSIYNLHKIGRNEPSSSILRISSRCGEQKADSHALRKLWPVTHLPDTDQRKVLYVISKNPSNMPQYAELCLFVMDRSGVADVLQPNKTPQSTPEWQFQARRLDSKPGWGRGWNNRDVKTQDGDFLRMSGELLNHLKKLPISSTWNGGQSATQRGSASSWEPRKTNTNWDMVTKEPFNFLSALNFRDMASSMGSRVTSVTNLFPQPSKKHITETEVAPSKSTGRLLLPLAFQDIPDSNTGSLSNQAPTTQGMINSSMVRRVADGGSGTQTLVVQNSYPTPAGESGLSQEIPGTNIPGRAPGVDDNSQLHDPQRESTSPSNTISTKRAFDHSSNDEAEEGASHSSGISPKRLRSDLDYEFTRDYLDEEELDQFLAQGYFA